MSYFTREIGTVVSAERVERFHLASSFSPSAFRRGVDARRLSSHAHYDMIVR